MNRRCTGDDATAARVVPRRARDGEQINAAVRVEALVLRGQHGVSQHLRDLIWQHRHRAACAILAQQMPQRRAIARAVDRRAFDRLRETLWQ